VVAQGRIRVQVSGEAGREIVLYRVEAGQSCVLTTSCLLSTEAYPAEGIAETEVQAIAIPQPAFQQALAESDAFRQYVFTNLGGRLAAVIARMEEIAFDPIPRRLARCLLGLAPLGGMLTLTHQELAQELGTAREVVSRHLKRLERDGLVHLGRGTLEIRNTSGLQALAKGLCD
jgi:CRP/FNR family transcriptional regulator